MQLCEYARESVCTLSQPGGLAEGHGSLARPTSIKENKASSQPNERAGWNWAQVQGCQPTLGLTAWGLKYAKK